MRATLRLAVTLTCFGVFLACVVPRDEGCHSKCDPPTTSVHELAMAGVVVDTCSCRQAPFDAIGAGDAARVRVFTASSSVSLATLRLASGNTHLIVGPTTVVCGGSDADAGVCTSRPAGNCWLEADVEGASAGHFRVGLIDDHERELDYFVGDVY